MAVEELLAAGHAALEAGRWDEARVAFEGALKTAETAEGLLGLGAALWWLGEPRASVEYHERAYVEFRRAGDATGAAWTAMWLCLSYKADFGNQAAASGWIGRAERVLAGVDPGPLQGWLWLTRAYQTTNPVLAQELTQRALEFARASGDLDLELCALGDLGKALVALGRVDEGFALIDEAMAGTLSGEYRRLDTVVFTSCSMLTACELTADLERATQWCRVADAFIRKYGCPFLYARCRTDYGGVLMATGHWADAERELTAAIRTSREACPALYRLALTRLAELRLRQGRLEEAEAILSDLDDEVVSAVPAATIRLARGEPDAAVALLRRRVSLLGEQSIEAAPGIELLVEAHLAGKDLDSAAVCAEQLGQLALRHSRDHLSARAGSAAARVALARGDTEAAMDQIEAALERFSRLELPLETARTRLLLARAVAERQPTVAIAEARRALAAFDQLGASGDADAAASFLRTLGATGRPGPKQVGVLTEREQEVLQLIGFGLSNPEIAQRLVISRKTVAHHVSNVLAKLGLRNRAEAAAYAVRSLGQPNHSVDSGRFDVPGRVPPEA